MPYLDDHLIVLLVAVAVTGALACGLALVTFALRQRRSERPERGAGAAGWRVEEDADRLRRVYFQKERRARAIRQRERLQHEGLGHEAEHAAGTGAAGDGQATAPPAMPGEVHYRAVLDLEGEATPERVRLAYKRMIAAYHPDKVAGLGAKLRHLAEEETKAINEAYAFFRRRDGA